MTMQTIPPQVLVMQYIQRLGREQYGMVHSYSHSNTCFTTCHYNSVYKCRVSIVCCCKLAFTLGIQNLTELKSPG